jgi:hypothetical protein
LDDFIAGRSLEGLLFPVLADALLVIIQEKVGGKGRQCYQKGVKKYQYRTEFKMS